MQKQGAQGLDCGLVKRGEKATERGAMRQALTSEERHERAGPRLEPLVKGFQRPFGADGIAKEHGEAGKGRASLPFPPLRTVQAPFQRTRLKHVTNNTQFP